LRESPGGTSWVSSVVRRSYRPRLRVAATNGAERLTRPDAAPLHGRLPLGEERASSRRRPDVKDCLRSPGPNPQRRAAVRALRVSWPRRLPGASSHAEQRAQRRPRATITPSRRVAWLRARRQHQVRGRVLALRCGALAGGLHPRRRGGDDGRAPPRVPSRAAARCDRWGRRRARQLPRHADAAVASVLTLPPAPRYASASWRRTTATATSCSAS